MSDDKKPFTVNDRRHFTPEGEARSSTEADAPAAAEPQPQPKPKAPPRPSEPTPEPADPAGGPDFVSLIVSLGAQASALLGLGGTPEESDDVGPVDLPAARGIIGLLEILERKTEGRRTPEEDQVLAGLLYELRMAFLARAR